MKRWNEKRRSGAARSDIGSFNYFESRPGPIDPMKYESPRNKPRITNGDALILVLSGNRRRIIINSRLNLSSDGRSFNPHWMCSTRLPLCMHQSSYEFSTGEMDSSQFPREETFTVVIRFDRSHGEPVNGGKGWSCVISNERTNPGEDGRPISLGQTYSRVNDPERLARVSCRSSRFLVSCVHVKVVWNCSSHATIWRNVAKVRTARIEVNWSKTVAGPWTERNDGRKG